MGTLAGFGEFGVSFHKGKVLEDQLHPVEYAKFSVLYMTVVSHRGDNGMQV